ncbi:MAG: lipoate--protein ligase family protein [Acaryochloridaceae cyanobacterium CSU_5_19]|nr:lipoate--protein ligase family protein [Acaryochloridaceae cyanobacterium CSU_5_19]
MALDAWLFEQCYRGLQPPTLRFYTWSRATISLGKNQRVWPTHWQELVWQNQPLEMVRRPTGGRAVLHGQDLTYAIALPAPTTQRSQAYQFLCQFLVQGWHNLGIQLQFGTPDRNYIHSPNCFTTATSADLVLADGFKLIGSAQAWQGKTVLQHGSMQWNADPQLIGQVFGNLPERTSQQGTSRPQELQRIQQLSLEEIMNSMLQAAQECFGSQLQSQPLSATEWEIIQTLASSTALPISQPRED